MKIFTLLLISFVFSFSLSTDVYAESKFDKEISKIRVKSINAYNSKDINSLMSVWHSNGRIIGRMSETPDFTNGYDNIKSFYIEQFESPDFAKISINSEDSEFIDGIYYDYGTQSILDENGKEILKACYLLLFKKEKGHFKTWREYFYPFCLSSVHH